MPRKTIDYSKSCIYKICCKDTSITDCYIGSTTDFVSRKFSHKSRCNNECNKCHDFKVYKYIRDNGGWDNWDMILLEKVNVNDGNELRKEERRWVEELNSTLNHQLPTRTQKEYVREYQKNNRDKTNERQKRYTQKNKEKIAEKAREKVECPICSSIICRAGLTRHQKTKKCLKK